MSNQAIQSIDWQNPINWSHSLTRGIIGWWMPVPNHLGYGSGTLVDLCKKYNGTLNNGPTWEGSRGRPGQWGSLVTTFADSSYVVMPNLGLSSAKGITLLYHGGWTHSGGGDGAVAMHSDGGFDNYDWGIGAASGGNTRAWVRAANGVRTSANMIADPGHGANDYWWSVATDSTISAYQSGTLLDSVAKDSGFDIEGGFALSRMGQRAASYTNITCSACVVWNRALSTAEMAEWKILSQRYYDGLLRRHSRTSIMYAASGGGGGGTANNYYYRQMQQAFQS